MKMSKSPIHAAIADVVIVRSENFREPDDYNALQSLRADIALRGQIDPGLLERTADGKYHPLKGFLRSTVIADLAAEGAIDPKTGKPFSTMWAFVVEDLTERERISLMLDHSQRKGLTRIGLFNAVQRAFFAGYTEEEVVTMVRDLLEKWFPPRRKIKPYEEDRGEDAAKYYRGTVQDLKRAIYAPEVLTQAFIAKMRGDQRWPKTSDLKELSTIHTKEMEADKTATITRTNPGPKFREAWDKLLAAVAEAEESGTGGNKPKPTGMANRQKVEDFRKLAESRILKVACSIILRDGVSEEKFSMLDKMALELEANAGADWHNLLTQLVAPPPVEDSTQKTLDQAQESLDKGKEVA